MAKGGFFGNLYTGHPHGWVWKSIAPGEVYKTRKGGKGPTPMGGERIGGGAKNWWENG